MKNIKNIVAILILAFTIFSCEKDNLDALGKWDLVPAVIEQPANETSVVLDETKPHETVTFSWLPAKSTAGYAITYSIVFDTLGSADFDTPIIEIPSSNGGKDLSVSLSFEKINEFLSFSGYPVNGLSTVAWAVKAKSLDKLAYAENEISFKRFPTEVIPTKLYISGTATENNNVLSKAIEMQRLKNSTGALSNIHEIYTSLTAGNTYKFYSEKALPSHQYGGSDNKLVKSGTPITVKETGQYRISVNLDNNTYSLLKIDKWSVVGDPISGGWGGDQPLTYQGGGIWKASLTLINPGNFVFRANGNWDYLLKKIVGSANNVIMESQAAAQGASVQDLNSTVVGNYFVTLNLSATGYTYTVEIDNTAPVTITAPNELYLLANGVSIQKFTKSGDTFSSPNFIPLQSSVNYTLNSQANGLGTSYSVNGQLGSSSSPDGDKVTGLNALNTTNTAIKVGSDRGLRLSIDFSQARLNWTYYNFKLFHWQNYDNRDEYTMTYQHPNKYTTTRTINANYDMKFISPWDFDIGSSTPNTMTGNLVNGSGGSNLKSVTTTGSYKVTITLNDTYQAGTYEFISQ
jgi:starch-binding outer membrane protein SusE/F